MNNKRSTITINVTRYIYVYIWYSVLFKKFFLSFWKKTNQRIFIHFYYYGINIVWSIVFWKKKRKKSRNIIRPISRGRKRNWNSRLFSFLYSMIENWSSEKMYRYIFFPIDIASKLKWKSDIEMKVNIFSGRIFVLMIVRWHEEIISIEWNEWSFPTIFHRDTMLKTQLVLIAFNYIIYFRLFNIRIHTFNSNGSSND